MDDYTSPIRFLYDDLVGAFETCNQPLQQILNEAVSKGLVRRSIFIDNSSSPIKTPFADLERREICLQDSYMCFLWCICYIMVGLHEATYNDVNSDNVVKLSKGSPLFDKLVLMINWATTLNVFWYMWPDDMPKPNEIDDRVIMTNALFLYSIRYQMYHEMAHLILHQGIIDIARKVKQSIPLNSDEQRRYRTAELQADDYAFDCMFLSVIDEGQRYMRVLGATIGQLSKLYLLSKADTSGMTHPDIDESIKRVLKKSKLSQEPFITYIHLTVTIGVQVFFTMHKVDYLPMLAENMPHETIEELEDDLFSILERLKAPHTK